MKIFIESIPHDQQRYCTAGDWIFDADGDLHVRVSHTTDDHDFLVAIHEAVEAWLCRKRGIAEQAITDFDIAFEARRAPDNDDEPGDDPESPYRREHFFATSLERLIAAELGVDWTIYDNTLNAL